MKVYHNCRDHANTRNVTMQHLQHSVQRNQPADDDQLDLLAQYVERFRHKRTKRISWQDSFKQGTEDKLDFILRYATSDSVRAQYNKHKRLKESSSSSSSRSSLVFLHSL
ncbi:hypothetical protein K492DRAFT_165347 [Lichtheimia hyalospora FSU 10163]|nr:hypothetical protein K492DRAFT_165347 [Lichtheimia hyalospora FSU 10163]